MRVIAFHTGYCVLCTALGMLATGCPVAPPDIDNDDNPAGVVLERSGETVYTPGELLQITVHIGARDGDNLTALGLTESLPEGWTFESAEAEGGGNLPSLVPTMGASGALEFVWITVPNFPYIFHYTIRAPAGAAGMAEISGQITYRQNAGPIVTDSVVTELMVANKAGVVLERTTATTYTPGGQTVVDIRIEADQGDSITAIGLSEMIPSGWAFVSATAVSGPGPAIAPEPGEGGTLEFVWIAPPEFPYTFSYTLSAPQDGAGTVEIGGHVEYRQYAGPLRTVQVVSTLQSSAR